MTYNTRSVRGHRDINNIRAIYRQLAYTNVLTSINTFLAAAKSITHVSCNLWSVIIAFQRDNSQQLNVAAGKSLDHSNFITCSHAMLYLLHTANCNPFSLSLPP